MMKKHPQSLSSQSVSMLHNPIWNCCPRASQCPHRSRAEIKYQPKNDHVETWTFFYLRRLLLFARLSYYFVPCVRLTKSSTLLLIRFPVSTQQVSIWSLKILLIYFFQNGHLWNSVMPSNDDPDDQLLKSWNSAARKRAMVCIDAIFDRNCESGKLFEGNLEMNGLFIFCSTLKALRWAMKCFGFIILINTLDTTLIRPD